MSVCGVDFGCLFASVAQAERGGVTVLLNENSMRLNANAVSIQGNQRFMGDKAQAIARSNYKQTAKCFRRFIGKKLADVADEIAWLPGVKFCEVDGQVGVEVMYEDTPTKLSMQHCVAMMLFKLSQISSMSNKGVGIAEIVISVPAFFDDAQRLAMLDACNIAGFRCLRLLNDTTAVALEYGIWRSMQKLFDEGAQRVMFIDLGYASYQVSIVEYVKGKLTVKATTWDETLGGRDFDLAIAKFISAEFEAKYKKSPMASVKSKMKLMDAAERAKKTLSPKGVLEANIFCECLLDDIDFSVKLSLDKFEELIAPLLARLAVPVEACLNECDMAASALHSIEIVGGGSRVSAVKRTLSELLGCDASAMNYGLKTTLNADECVSKGCALMAAMLSPRFKVKEYEVVDSAPFAVKLQWDADQQQATPMATEDKEEDKEEDLVLDSADATALTIFARGTDFPTTKRVTFRRDRSFELKASYAQGGGDIGTFGVDFPEGHKKGDLAKVRVHVELSGHGTMSVKTALLVTEVPEPEDEGPASSEEKKDGGDEKKDDAMAVDGEEKKDGAPAAAAEGGGDAAADAAAATKKKKKYKKEALAVTARVAAMSKKALDATIEREAQMANTDRLLVETADKRNELEAFIYKMRDEIIGDLRPFCTDGEKATFEAALEEAEDWLYNGDGYDTSKSNYAKRLEAVQALSAPITARCTEASKLPARLEQIRLKLASLESFAATPPDHVTADEAATVAKEAAAAAAWLADLAGKQEAAPQAADPVLTCSMITAKITEVDKVTRSILAKKAPKPEPKPEAKADDAAAKANDDKKAEPAPSSDTKPDVDMPDSKDDASAAKDDDAEMADASPQHKD